MNDELPSFPKLTEDPWKIIEQSRHKIEALIRERDEARAKAIEEAALWCDARAKKISDEALPVSAVNELFGASLAILALIKDKPNE